MFGYRVPPPDEAMLVSGGKHAQGVPFKVIVGRGAFVLPGFRKARFLTLALQEAEVAEPCVTGQGIGVNVRAVIAFKVGNDSESIVNAGQRFLSDQSQMPVLTGRIFAGHLRSIVGGMTVEEIVTQRQRLAEEVLDASKLEMAKIGLIVDSLQIQSIDDNHSGYIDQMAAPHRANIARDAAIAQARAEQEAKIAQAQAQQAAAAVEQESQRQQSSFGKETAVVQAQNAAAVAQAQAENEARVAMVRAQNKAQVDTAQAKAAQQGPLAQAQATQEVTSAQAELATRQAELRQRQLVTEVVRPAEAEAGRVTTLASAEAQKMRVLAEAAASSNRVQLDQMLIQQLPQTVQAAAAGLAGANLTVINGAEGIGQLVTSLVSQGLAVLQAVRAGVSPDGAATHPPGTHTGEPSHVLDHNNIAGA